MSYFQKILKHFATERGRSTALYCVSTVGIGIFCARWVPHSVGLDYYQKFVACYKHGVQQNLSDKVKSRFEKALDMVKDMDDMERSRYKMFCVFGMEPFHAGSYYSIFGSIIGIPANFEYEKPSDIPKEEIMIKKDGRPTLAKLDDETGKQLDDTMILTEDEQIFAILKEILACRTFQWPLNCLYPIIGVVSSYAMAFALNNRLHLRQRPLSLRLVMYTLVGLFNLGNYFFAVDWTQMYYDTVIDKEIASMGKEMVEAGKSYYDKVLKRNIVIRNFTGNYSVYSATGNVNMFLRQKCMPFTARRDFFNEQLKTLQEDAKL
ncbi:uncharacterized protein LOC134834295 [Culicoides brevitarsis]|uniref:uncharacterized protein LOC134834295 n=1 Tax=Culicoides brevitarsis TaxID=469753 RepID=UPI00307BD7E0